MTNNALSDVKYTKEKKIKDLKKYIKHVLKVFCR